MACIIERNFDVIDIEWFIIIIIGDAFDCLLKGSTIIQLTVVVSVYGRVYPAKESSSFP